MAQQFGTLEVKRMRGKLHLIGTATTPRGTRFISKVVPLDIEKMNDPDFKGKLPAALDKLFA